MEIFSKLKILLILSLGVDSYRSARTTAAPPTVPPISNTTKFPEKLSPGVFVSKLDTPLIYESYAALTFDFELPMYNNTMVFDYACPDSLYKTNFSCPLYHPLHKIRDELKPFLELEHLRHVPEVTSKTLAFDIPSCEEILPHFLSTSMSLKELKSYQKRLRTCVDGLLVKTPLITRFSQLSSSIRTTYLDMVKGFIDNYYVYLPSSANRIDKAILLNTLMSSNVLGFVQQLEEAQMWTDVLNECNAAKIPGHLISAPKLRSYLQHLETKLKGKNLEYVLPIEDLSVYYKSSSLTDCVLTQSQLFIRILIPVKSRESSWNLHSLTSVPFTYTDGEDGSQLICYVKSLDSVNNHYGATGLYAYDSQSKLSFQVSPSCAVSQGLNPNSNNNHPSRNLFCHSGEDSSSLLKFKKTCASEVFEMDQTQILKACDLHCESVESFHTPIVTRVAPDTFYLVGKPNDSIRVECGDAEGGITNHTVVPAKEGSLEIQLPCSCHVILPHRNKKLMVQEPCSQNLTVYNMKPLHLAPILTEIDETTTWRATEFPTTTPKPSRRRLEDEDSVEFLPEKFKKDFDW